MTCAYYLAFRDPVRNRLIADDVVSEMRKGGDGPFLVITEDEEQDNILVDMLKNEGILSLSLDPDIVAGRKKSLSQQLTAKKIQVVLASRQLFQKMDPQTTFEALFLTTPLNFRGRLIQWFQKVLKRDDGQPPIKVYDYVDSKISILDNFFRMRSYAFGLRLPRPALPK